MLLFEDIFFYPGPKQGQHAAKLETLVGHRRYSYG